MRGGERETIGKDREQGRVVMERGEEGGSESEKGIGRG